MTPTLTKKTIRLFEDTHPIAENMYIKLMAQAPVWKKVQIMDNLYQTAVSMARAGIKRCYPHITETKLRRELATMFLGKAMAEKLYPVPDEETK